MEVTEVVGGDFAGQIVAELMPLFKDLLYKLIAFIVGIELVKWCINWMIQFIDDKSYARLESSWNEKLKSMPDAITENGKVFAQFHDDHFGSDASRHRRASGWNARRGSKIGF